MLSEYKLTNFKPFADILPISLRRITLIYGPNSSGKSSIIQSILLLKQTIDESDDPTVPLLPKGNLVDLGSYREFIHGHDVKRSFSVDASFPLTELPKSAQPFFGFPQNEKDSSLGFSFAFKTEMARGDTILATASLRDGDGTLPLATYAAERREVESPSRQSAFQLFDGEAIRECILKLQSVDTTHGFFSKVWEDFQRQEQGQRANIENQIKTYRDYVNRQRELLKSVEDQPQRTALEAGISRFEDLRVQSEARLARARTPFNQALKEMEAFAPRIELQCRGFLPSGVIRGPQLPADTVLFEKPRSSIWRECG
jgi:hypothetical protein